MFPESAQSYRLFGNRILPPVTGLIAGDPSYSEEWFGDFELSFVRSVKSRRRLLFRDGHHGLRLNPVFDFGEVLCQPAVEGWFLGRIERDESIMGGLSYRGLDRRVLGSGIMWQIALITALDRIHGIEDRDVHNGHRPG